MQVIQLWGLTIAVLNVMYSFAYLGTSWSDLYLADEGDILPWVWIVIYTCNAALNTYLFLRLLKSDLIALMLWFPFTCMLILFRLFGIQYDKLSSTYRIVTILTNVYIFISLIIMALVYRNFAKPRKETPINSPAQPWRATGKSVSSPADNTIARNRIESTNFITQPDFYAERNERIVEPLSIAAAHRLNHHDSDFNCCDNTSCDGDNLSGGGGCDGGGDGGGCDGGGDGGGYDGGGDGGDDCGGGNDD